MNDQARLVVSSVGIFVCYFYFGILQEKITRGRYGEEINEDGTKGERFTFTLALVGVQCMFNWAFARGKKIGFYFDDFLLDLRFLFLAILFARPQAVDKTHYGYYASSALTYLLAMVSSNMALRWVAVSNF